MEWIERLNGLGIEMINYCNILYETRVVLWL